MRELHVTCFANQVNTNWILDLKKILQRIGVTEFQEARQLSEMENDALGKIAFVDSSWKGLRGDLDTLRSRVGAVFLVVSESDDLPDALVDERVDDVLVYPLRPVEVIGKLKHYRQILMWNEVTQANSTLSSLIEQLHEDLALAQRIQKARIPKRFPDLKGFRLNSRYLAGMKSGGDFFDLAESNRDKSGVAPQFSMILTDSSSYGLSSALLSVLMKVAMKLSTDEMRSSYDTVRKIYDELLLTLGEKDRLSMFYGIVSRRDLSLKYLNLGSSRAFVSSNGGSFEELPSQGEAITRSSTFPSLQDGERVLSPKDRLVLVSDGLIEVVGGEKQATRLLNDYSSSDAADILNELIFRVKRELQDPDDLPNQDCTAIVLDVDARVMRIVG